MFKALLYLCYSQFYVPLWAGGKMVFVWNGLFRSLTNHPNLLALSMI